MREINGSLFKKYYFLIILLLFGFLSFAQYNPNSFYQSTELDSSLENTLLFRVENSNFLKNDEYFNDIIQGYTLIGYFINPKLVFYPAKNAKIEAGVHFLKYSGIDSYTQAYPTLTFHYKASKSTDIILGTLYGSTNHEMIEPIFRYEYFFTDNVENGLQFLFHNQVYKGDIWINWQQFIFKGEDKQEIFTLGLSNRFFLNKKDSKHSFSIPLQVVFIHQGGQINETSTPLTTLNNTAIGLAYNYNPSGGFIKSANIESYYVGFKDMSTTYQLPYIQGYGIYSMASVKASYFDLRVSHWFGDFYTSGRGHPIFTSISTFYDNYTEPQRALISGRLMFEKNILKGLDIGAGFESYFDLYNYYLDYWYMFYIHFNRDFFIKKFK